MATTLIKTDINSSLKTNKPEIELLLCCARSKMDEQTKVKVESLVSQEIDWDFLLEIAIKHKLLPLLYYHLNTINVKSIPPEIITFLRNFFQANIQRNLLLTSELLKVLKIFKEHQIVAIPLKGPVLATCVYGSFGLRTISDLDIIVEKKKFIQAQDLLLELEYQPGKLNNPDYYQQAQFYPSNNTFCIDLHYDFAPKNFFVSVNTTPFWEDLGLISIAKNQINTLSQENLILYLCLEGSKEHWRTINRISDLAESIQNYDFDWDSLLKRAKNVGKEGVLFLGIFLAKEILDLSIPDNIWQLVENNLRFKPSREQINKFLFSQSFDGLLALQWHWFNLQAFKTISEKIKYCWLVIKVNYHVRTSKIIGNADFSNE
jgi:hypothetical protein